MKRALVRLGPIATAELLSREVNPAFPRLYDRARLAPNAPVLIDHDQDRDPVGRVLDLHRFDDVGGLWLAARIEIDDPPEWLRKGTPVSLGGNTLARGEFRGWPITRAVLVREISLVSPAMEPEQPGAKVLLLRDAEYDGEPVDYSVGRGDTIPRRNCRNGPHGTLMLAIKRVSAGYLSCD
jgi:hypothetical protein